MKENSPIKEWEKAKKGKEGKFPNQRVGESKKKRKKKSMSTRKKD